MCVSTLVCFPTSIFEAWERKKLQQSVAQKLCSPVTKILKLSFKKGGFRKKLKEYGKVLFNVEMC
jgi:hypothetical protein